MHAGKLDRRLTLRRFVVATDGGGNPVTDDFGAEVGAWSDVATVWASKQDISDGERVRAQQVGASITTRFQIRPLDGGARPSVKYQAVCEGVTYEITAVKEIGRREGWEISAVAQVA